MTDCVAAKSAATKGGTNSSSAATANVAAKAAKHAVKKAASAKPKEKKSASGKTTAAAVPLPRARPDSSGAFAPARAAARGTSTGLPQPPAVPLAQTPTPQTSDPDLALVKSAIDSLRSGGADKATGVQATISDPAARKLVEWIILRSDRNGAGSARYTAFIAANPSWPSLAMFRRRAHRLRAITLASPIKKLRPQPTERAPTAWHTNDEYKNAEASEEASASSAVANASENRIFPIPTPRHWLRPQKTEQLRQESS